MKSAIKPRVPSHQGVTIIELLVVISMISLLASLLIPGLSAAREQTRAVICRSNLQQLILANTYYAQDHRGVLCPGAAEFHHNLHRWHGRRNHVAEAFDSSRGSLVCYLGPDGLIRQCPTFPTDDIASGQGGGFERGNGGYGYNNRYLGVRGLLQRDESFIVDDDREGTNRDRIRRPAETVMFTDASFAAGGLIEYSFAEPRFHPEYPGWRADPSIHFRHRELANVGWADGHVDAHGRSFTWSSALFRADPDRWNIGWFGEADDNSLFDVE